MKRYDTKVESKGCYLVHAFPTTGKTRSFHDSNDEEQESLKNAFESLLYSVIKVEDRAVIKVDVEIKDGEVLATVDGFRFEKRLKSLDQKLTKAKEKLDEMFEDWILYVCVNRYIYSMQDYKFLNLKKLMIVMPIDYNAERLKKIGREDIISIFGDPDVLKKKWLEDGLPGVKKFMRLEDSGVIVLDDNQFLNDVIIDISKKD